MRIKLRGIETKEEVVIHESGHESGPFTKLYPLMAAYSCILMWEERDWERL